MNQTVKLTIDKLSAIPYYHQVKEAVRALIANGELRSGDMLPSEFNLSEQLGISRLVVHRAFRELVTEGLLIRKRAQGTFVSPPIKPSFMIIGPLFSMTEYLTKDGLKPSNRVLLQEVIPANPEVIKELRLTAGTRVIHIRHLRLANEIPFAIEETYIPYERFPKLAELNLRNRSTYEALDTIYDALPQEALDQITASSATPSEAKLLDLKKGAPVMRVKRVSTDRQGRLVEYSRLVFHGERYQFVGRMKRST
jgi:GntR family transcriptional regulator